MLLLRCLLEMFSLQWSLSHLDIGIVTDALLNDLRMWQPVFLLLSGLSNMQGTP